jgi:hypothetical protein
MTEAEIFESRTSPSTFKVPRIAEFRGMGPDAETQFQSVRSEILTSPQVHLGYPELPGSVAGAWALANVGQDISYYTVRKPEVTDATVEWLQQKGMPSPEQVVICKNPQDKLMRIITDKLIAKEREGETLPTIILVDDGMTQLVEAANAIIRDNPVTRQFMEHIILVGFGVSRDTMSLEGAFYPETGLRTLALPNWEQQNLQSVIESVTG